MQGLQMGTAQPGKWRLVLGKEGDDFQNLFWRIWSNPNIRISDSQILTKQRAKKVEAVVLNANMIAAVGGTNYKAPQPDTRTNLPPLIYREIKAHESLGIHVTS